MAKFIKTLKELPEKNRTLRSTGGEDVGPGDWIELHEYIAELGEEFVNSGQLSYDLETGIYYLNEEIEVNLWDDFKKIPAPVGVNGK